MQVCFYMIVSFNLQEEATPTSDLSNSSQNKILFAQRGFFCMLFEVSSRICSDLCFCILESEQQISACISQWQSHSQ